MTKKEKSASVEKVNFTIKLDRYLVRALKVVAAKRGASVSALLTESAARIVQDGGEYEQAMKRSLARMENGWQFDWQKPKSRDELH